ncbi:MAG: hypothetical protein M9965_21085 [Anaerolineae bacterium]|nr:hypothetical protein [Anaerolineae bacterium]
MRTTKSRSRFRVANWLLFISGLLLVLFSVGTDALRLDLNPGFGVLQMFLLTTGISALTLAGFLSIWRRRPTGTTSSLQANIGVRVGLTGLVFIYVAGFADLARVGTHVQPRFARPYTGPLQTAGIVLGIVTVLVGLLLYYTSRGVRQTSSLDFLIKESANSSESENSTE